LGSTGIKISDQCNYAENALRMMGLVSNFAKLVIFCGHGSVTQNNPYASALDCGACGGRHGGSNAQILAEILNEQKVRKELSIRGIEIPKETIFLAAKHNTTTDEMILFEKEMSGSHLNRLKKDFQAARVLNSEWRSMNFIAESSEGGALQETLVRSSDWAQTRPEWGLARNASFIIGPRSLTKDFDLEGRAFLHSYDWQKDHDSKSLETILTAPMVVAQWINNQYLFSTLDNVAFGSGSKVTQNIAGKLGVMQGNASDLMTGLALQSVNRTDLKPYHEPMRLQTVALAPREKIDPIIARNQVLKKLFGNGWVTLSVIDPRTQVVYMLQRNLSWKAI
jgi:uncharacterized protein